MFYKIVVPRFGLNMKNTCEAVYLLIKLRVVDGCFRLITSSRAQGIINLEYAQN